MNFHAQPMYRCIFVQCQQRPYLEPKCRNFDNRIGPFRDVIREVNDKGRNSIVGAEGLVQSRALVQEEGGIHSELKKDSYKSFHFMTNLGWMEPSFSTPPPPPRRPLASPLPSVTGATWSRSPPRSSRCRGMQFKVLAWIFVRKLECVTNYILYWY